MQRPETFVDGRVRGMRASVGPMDNNVYLLKPADGPGILIDAAAEPEALIRWVEADGPVDVIATTHQHHDHIGALAEVAAETGARCVAGADAAAIGAATGVDVEQLHDGDTLPLGSDELEVIELHGHTPGGACYVWRPDGLPVQLFTGDSLFPGGVGKTRSPEDFHQLLDDVTTRLFDAFPDDTAVLPGHGQPTTLGAERPHLSEWRKRGW